MTEISSEGANVPKWFISIMSIAITLLTAVALAAIPWAHNLDKNVTTLTIRMEGFDSTKSKVADLEKELDLVQKQVDLISYWKKLAEKKLDKLP